MNITTIQRIWNEYKKEDERLAAHPYTENLGHPFTICTTQARWIKKHHLPFAKVMGFANEDNPTAKIAEDIFGHDFLVVDNRYIVDFWAQDVNCNMEVPLVTDMHTQPELVAKWYGDPLTWVNMDLSDQETDNLLDQLVHPPVETLELV